MNVFKEAQKAETKLKNLSKREQEAIAGVVEGYANRRAAIVSKLDLQVRLALQGAGVLERNEGDDEETVDVPEDLSEDNSAAIHLSEDSAAILGRGV